MLLERQHLAEQKVRERRRREREERRRVKKMQQRIQGEEEDEELAKKIAVEERKLLEAQRKLESIRILDELLERVKVNLFNLHPRGRHRLGRLLIPPTSSPLLHCGG